MTLVRVLSDLHLEHHDDEGRDLIASLDPTEVDVLILAGDITNGPYITRDLTALCRRFKDAHVLYVHGNHEYYGTDPEQVVDYTSAVVAANPNLSWLNGTAVTIDGHRFHGHTLWFPQDPAATRYRRYLNDFHLIDDFEPWVYQQNASARTLLAQVGPGDIVITHHLPSPRSVHPKYAGSPLNSFFVGDTGQLIDTTQPALWIHGHTHESMDYQIGPTRVLCNPRGYPHELNPDFEPRLTIELGE